MSYHALSCITMIS